MPSIRTRGEFGHYLTKSLFLELSYEDKRYVAYTLKNKDYNNLPSLYRLYMEIADPTEYRFATECFEGWEHWQQIANAEWMKPYIDSWRQELEIKLRSEALVRLEKTAQDADDKNSFQANKVLLAGGWKTPEESKRGRPSKDEVNKAIKIAADEQRRLEEDAQRVLQ